MFKRKVPEAPPITNEQQYIAWFVEHSEKVVHIRKLYTKNLDTFVTACTKGASKVLDECPNGDVLFERVGDLSGYYETKMKPLVDKRGGLEYCPTKLQGAVAGLMMDIAVGMEFLEKKYKHREAMKIFSAADNMP